MITRRIDRGEIDEARAGMLNGEMIRTVIEYNQEEGAGRETCVGWDQPEGDER